MGVDILLERNSSAELINAIYRQFLRHCVIGNFMIRFQSEPDRNSVLPALTTFKPLTKLLVLWLHQTGQCINGSMSSTLPCIIYSGATKLLHHFHHCHYYFGTIILLLSFWGTFAIIILGNTKLQHVYYTACILFLHASP